MLTDWTDTHTAAFQKEIMTFGHDLESTGLFSDEAIIKLLETHPSQQLDVCSMNSDGDPRYPNLFMTGDFRGISGETILEAAKAGRIWINLRKAMNLHDQYRELLNDMYSLSLIHI